MSALFEEVSTITAKGQAIIPKSMRQALGVGYGGKIAFAWMNAASHSTAPLRGMKTRPLAASCRFLPKTSSQAAVPMH